MSTIFNGYIEFVTILLMFYICLFFLPWDMWDLSSPQTGIQAAAPSIGGEILTTGWNPMAKY